MIRIAGIGFSQNEIPYKVKLLLSDSYVILRSSQIPAAAGIKYDLSFDDLYEKAEDFDSLYSDMANKVIEAEKSHDSVLYLVEGDEYADKSVMRLFELRPDCVFLNGNDLPAAYSARISAYDIDLLTVTDCNASLKVADIDSRELCGDVKLKLMDFFSDEEKVWVLQGERRYCLPLYEIDRTEDFSKPLTLIIPPAVSLKQKRFGIASLIRIMRRLIAPDGCDWDKAQTHSSIRVNMIEEAYEAVDAIDRGDIDDMIEELGDVLLQAVFHCVIAEKDGEFDFNDVLTRLCRKLVERHPHVFGEIKTNSPDEALSSWEKAKAKEKNYSSLADILARIPDNFPSLLKAEKIYKKLLKSPGVKKGIMPETSSPEIQLFKAVCNCADNGIDAEVALREVCRKLTAAAAEKEGGEFTVGELLCDL